MSENLDFRLQDFFKFHVEKTTDSPEAAAILAAAQILAMAILKSRTQSPG